VTQNSFCADAAIGHIVHTCKRLHSNHIPQDNLSSGTTDSDKNIFISKTYKGKEQNNTANSVNN
jgi:hypothetical protein